MNIKERFLAMCSAWKDDDDMLEFLEDASNNFIAYVQAVTMMETRISIIKVRMEGQDLVEAIQDLDRARRNCHEAAIASVTSLGRAARADGLEPLYAGDINDRLAIADFCLEFVNDFFKDRTGANANGKVNIDELITAARRDEA